MSDSNSGSGPVNKEMIRELADLLKETELNEIEVETEEFKIRVARGAGGGTVSYAPPPGAAAPAPAASSAPAEAAPASADLSNHPGAVASPMVGTVYVSPEPGAAAFVKEGATVSQGDTLLIVEAMKTMNPIPAPKSGTVKQILVQDAQPVEFGEVLIVIE
ncbi:Biotin carboxyl carrier protein of acetyl-CoA carboxylase [Candidatus Phaeomarinobacter ectocarpi]|uniref:Biotin carboxyl carrier protein of acetyl-CoA carboxylase n=1 Tax=Candidatus Phaeomarinibacter ectocarpi TaxID=1458461 RepID=X5MEF8_9HYPH|nr:acetyl-CoA carboxylase biotin carboxyl carrier protein [Candidatus Phaeomarinobacter ectocarpi]CDO60907.1 Biotin carboxyl carrier protein of acetyl-CoA carboxylase [Candidatus Phaeomarinobacter ectocarpi]